MAQLIGSPQPVSLGGGYFLRAPGIRGNATLNMPRPTDIRGRGRVAEDGTAALDQALAATNVAEVRQVDLQLASTPPGESSRSLRSIDGQEMLELQVPDLGPETGQLVLACDETGVLTWHLPEQESAMEGVPSSARGTSGVKRFLIPATQLKPATQEQSRGRSLLGVVGRKLLKVLVYPVTDAVLGPISEAFAGKWEERNRPYGLRNFAPDNFRNPVGTTIGSSDWDRLASGRALLFIHGTFSTAHAAFNLLTDEAMSTLAQRYGSRVFAFNHFTLSHDPLQNIQWLQGQLPVAERPLELDIICHSRGGLVARSLANASSTRQAKVQIKRIVFVGVPNQGTLLADPDHVVKMIDRVTTALNLFPTGPVTETLEVLITAIKVIGHGALKGLSGLASMRPSGDFLKTLNDQTSLGPEYFAVAADFQPRDEGLKALIAGTIANEVLDRVFENAANDLVVPELGVYGKNGCAGFPIPDTRLLKVPPNEGIMHTTMFSYTPAVSKLMEWLA